MNQSMQKSSKIQDLCKQGLMCDIFYSQLSLVHTLWCPTVVPAYRPSTCSNTQIGFQATTTLHTRRSCDQSETQHGCSGHKTSWRYTSPSNCIGIKGLGGIFWHQSPPLKRKNNVQPKFRPSLIAKAWCEQWHWFCGAGLLDPWAPTRPRIAGHLGRRCNSCSWLGHPKSVLPCSATT